MGDERVKLIEFHRVYGRFRGPLGRGRRRRKASGGLVDPVDDGLVVDFQMSCDAPEVHAVHVELEGLTTQDEVIAMLFGSGRVGTPAVLALAPCSAAEVGSGLMLLSGFPQVGQGDIRLDIRQYSRKLTPM